MFVKRLTAFLLVVVVVLLVSCSSHKELLGTWYVDENGTRNAIQLSENDKGETVFIWAIYDLTTEQTTSVNKGRFEVSGNTVTFIYSTGTTELTVDYKVENDVLTLNSETGKMVLNKYEISE